MIILDGNLYKTHENNYAHKQVKNAVLARSLTGGLNRIEGGVLQNEYNITLKCSPNDITNLRVSFAKTSTTGTPPANILDFTDEEGVHWNPQATGTGRLNTGVYFTMMDAPAPVTAAGWVAQNAFLVKITLVANDKAI